MSNKNWLLYQRLLKYVKPFWPMLFLGILANIFYSLIDASFTYLLKPFFDKGFINVDTNFIKTLPWILLLGISVRGLFSAFGSYCMTSVARSFVNFLRQKVFAHIIRLPAKHYNEAASGQMLSKIIFDVEQVALVSANALADFIQNFFLIIGLVTVMFYISWQLTLVFLFTTPLTAVMVNYTNRRVRRISHKVQASMGEITAIASEVIEGYREVRIFGAENYEINKFNSACEFSRKNDMKVAASKAWNVFGVQFIIALGISAIILFSIQLTSKMLITPGSFLAIIAAMLQLIRPMKTLATLNSVIQRGLAGAESVFNVLDLEVEKSANLTFKSKVQGNITFKDVNFCYTPNQLVLKNLNFEIKAHQTVALVGHSGSGKSTIASLISAFYQINTGLITIDSIPINKLSLQSLRQQIALVGQQVTLFNDSISNNISYGSENKNQDEIIKAAQLAYAHEFICTLPNQYATIIGENGVLLSGGQRQRLALARAFYKDAPILILDEATSSLDNESEQYIQRALGDLMQNRTTLIIAHRLSTIIYADLILVLDDGKIIEWGNHQELIARGGHYANLYQGKKWQEYESLA